MRCFPVVLCLLAAAGCSPQPPNSEPVPPHATPGTPPESTPFAEQVRARTWLGPKLQAGLLAATRRAFDNGPESSPRLTPDRADRGPTQFARWIDGTFKEVADGFQTDPQVEAVVAWVEVRLALFVATPTPSAAQREAAARRWVAMLSLIPTFVNESFEDTPQDVRSRIAEAATKALVDQPPDLDDYFDLEHLALRSFDVSKETVFPLVRRPRYVLNDVRTAYGKVREAISAPDVADESKAFFVNEYVEWQAGFVSRAWRHVFDEQSSDRELLAQWLPRLDAAGRGFRETLAAIRANAALQTPQAKPRSAESIRVQTSTATPAGVPTPPK